MISTTIACIMLALAAFIWWFCFRWLPRQPVQPEDREVSERAALEAATEIREYLRPAVDGKVVVRATDFGELQ